MTLIAPAEKDRPRESGAFAWIVVIALGLMSAGTTGTYSIIAGSFIAPVCEDLGFDYTSFSFLFHRDSSWPCAWASAFESFHSKSNRQTMAYLR